MTYRASDSSSRDCYSQPQSRLNQQIRCDSTDEGCPVLEESGTVCGETNSLGVFQEFRQMYDDCLKKLEGTQDGSATLRKLTPFKKLIDDLWEQNTMLVETVEELEQEATNKVTNLQEKLNKSCQKMCEYEEDIRSLTKVIQRYCENGVFDTTGLKFNTISPECAFSNCEKSCPNSSFSEFNPKPDPMGRGKSTFQDGRGFKSPCEPGMKPKGIKCESHKSSSKSKIALPKIMEAVGAGSVNKANGRSDGFLEKLPCKDLCSDDDCYCSNGEQLGLVSEEVPDEKKYQGCKGAININFNLGKEAVMNSSDCCCSCTCINSNETEDC